MNSRSTSSPEWTAWRRPGTPSPRTIAVLLEDWASRPGTLPTRLAAAFDRAIARGEIPPGARLPSERALAEALAVSRTTVVAAYERLRQDGRVESRVGSGTRVHPGDSAMEAPDRSREVSLPATSTLVLRTVAEDPAGSISFLAAHLPGASEVLEKAWAGSRREISALARQHGYMPLGLPALRAALARHLTSRGLPTREEQILVTNGAQQGIDLIASHMLAPGDEVVAEDPTYPGALDLFAAARARVVATAPAAEPGALEQIAAAIRRPRARLLYLLPTFHNPTGAVLPERPRREIARLSEQTGVAVIEDHTLSDLSLGPEAPLPIAAFAKAAPILTIGSFSKLFWVGLRIGWIRGPEPLIHRLARRKAMDDLGSSVLSQAVAVRLLESVDAVTALRRGQVEARFEAMSKALTRLLPDWKWRKPAGGLTLWVRIPRGNASELAQVAARHGVSVLPGP